MGRKNGRLFSRCCWCLVAIVQGGLIRIINPKLGEKKSVYFGLLLYAIGYLLFAFASESWMMFVFLIPYCLGGIAGPALQGIISNRVADNEQGELQGVLTSLMSVTSIVGPPLIVSKLKYIIHKRLLRNCFYFFLKANKLRFFY